MKRANVPRLTDFLVEMGVPREAIDSAMERRPCEVLVGEYLVSEGVCTKQQVALALARQAIARGDNASAETLTNQVAADAESHRERSLAAVTRIGQMAMAFSTRR